MLLKKPKPRRWPGRSKARTCPIDSPHGEWCAWRRKIWRSKREANLPRPERPHTRTTTPPPASPPLPLGLSPGFATGCGPPAARNTADLHSCVRLHGPKKGSARALHCAHRMECVLEPRTWGYAQWTPSSLPRQITLERDPLRYWKQSGNDPISPTGHHLARSSPHRQRFRQHQWQMAFVLADKHLDLDHVRGRAGKLAHGGGAVAMRPLEIRFANTAALFCRESWCGHGFASG